MTRDYAPELKGLVPYEFFPYASYMKGRTGGDFKRHKTLAHAKSAVNQYGFGKPARAVYEWVGESPFDPNGYWIGVDA